MFRLLVLLLLAGTAHAQTQMQFPTTPWGGFAPAVVQCGGLYGANFNTTADQAIPVSFPSYRYVIDKIEVTNPSVSMTTAAGGVYTGASKTGQTLVASGQAYSGLTTNAVNTDGSALALTLATSATTDYLNSTPIYLSLTTAQGAAATADVRVYCRPLY
jgi:hypothetical protein